MKNKTLKICDTVVHPGEMANLALPLPEQYSCSPLYMPIKVIHGKTAGPCVVVFSGLKGNELNGLEIANRLVMSVSASEISGTIIAIPVVNVYGLTHYPHSLPSVGKEFTDCFPGNSKGSYGERIAYLFREEILKKADYCIELQTGLLNHNILPQVYCNFENPEEKKLAKAFNSPVIINVDVEKSSLRQTTEKINVPLIVYQAGEAMRFDENAITLGVSGIKNVMKAINVFSSEPVEQIKPISSKEEGWITAHKGGILHEKISLGQIIEENEIIGTISDPFGADDSEPIKSKKKGVVVGINSSPLIYEGLQIFKIASFLDDEKAETIIGEWDKKQPDSYIG
jgi:uncharacterized protein